MSWGGRFISRGGIATRCVSNLCFCFHENDQYSEAGYDRDHVWEYIRLFPESPLASMWKGYFAYVEVALWGDDDNEAPTLSPLDDPVDIVTVRLSF